MEETNKEVNTVPEVKETALIDYDTFKKVEITLGRILSAEKIEGSDKLLKLSVDFKEESGPRQILSGIQKYFPDESVLVGQKCMFVTNLAPRKMMGLESNGMLFALGGGDVPFSLLKADDDVPEGTKAN
jgi:methionyl-tRNA synthetase